MDKRKSETRQRVLLPGKIILHEGGLIDCMTRNKSASGALIKITSVVGIAETFDLIIGSAEPRSVKVAWRKQGQLGVSFIS